MNKILIFLLLIVTTLSLSAYKYASTNNTPTKENTSKVALKPFDIKFNIESLKANEYNLAATVKLNKGDYIISPFSTDGFYLNFSMKLDNSTHFLIDGELTESPKSIPEVDPIINKPVRFVRANTIFKQKLKVEKQGDFEVSGLVEFLLEPSCVPYDVAFVLASKAGKMTVKDVKITISEEYKGVRN